MGFDYKGDLKELLPEYLDYLVSKGDLEERGDGFYTCPFCNSGNKQKNTAAFHVKGTRYQCFSCTKKGDIFDLVGHMEGLENDFAKHYNRALKIMRPYLNGDKKEKSKSVKVPEVPKINQEDYTDYLHKCHKDVLKIDYFRKRGLSRKIIDDFCLGYDAENKLVTIPYNPDCKGYVDRVLWDSNSKYYKHGNELFNVAILYTYRTVNDLFENGGYVFVTEGQIDALSFVEVGLDAVGLGGTNEITRLKNQLNKRSSNKTLILALDNDKAGRHATGKLIEELAEVGINQKYIVISDLYKQYKDANEFLVADRVGFIERMKKIATDGNKDKGETPKWTDKQ